MATVTVGIPTYNRAEHLREALRFVLAQTFSDFELIVCDDASEDDTERVVTSIGDQRVRYYRNEVNLNIPGNLNRILDLARGEFVVILHDHDEFHPDLLRRCVDLLRAHPDVSFVHPGVAWIDPDGSNYQELLQEFPEIMDGRELVDLMLSSDDFSCPITACAMVRKSAYAEVGGAYDPSFGFVSDMDMWLRLASVGKAGYLREPLITCRRRDENHQYAGVSWDLLQALTAIHATNIERFYTGSQLQRARSRWRQKRDRIYLGSLIAAAAQGDIESFRGGLSIIRSERAGPLTSILTTLAGMPLFDTLLVRAAAGINGLRRRLRGRARAVGHV